MELYKQYRPMKLSEVVGQPEAVATLTNYLKNGNLPHSIMFTGPPGTGKTSLAQMLGRMMTDADSLTMETINCAACEPIDTIRRIIGECRADSPLVGSGVVKVYDEFQSLSRAGFAQQACLELFEFTNPKAYHFLCTTNPGKIDAAIRSRCTEIATKPLTEKDMRGLLEDVTNAEDMEIVPATIDRIIDLASGSARTALVFLDKLVGVPAKEHMGRLGLKEDAAGAAIDLPRALCDPRCGWNDVRLVLSRLTGENPETLRYLVLSYAQKIALGRDKPPPRIYAVLQAFRDAAYDAKFAGIVAMCMDVCNPSGR